jgi:hypothetical protein
MSDKVDTRVSPALDPETYRAVEGYNDETRRFLDGVVNAFNEIYQTVGKAHDARALAESNPALTPENRILHVARDVDTAKRRSVARLANAERDLRANIAHTEKLLSEPLTQQAALGSLNVEVRAHVKSLKREQREALMREALESDDDATLTAVLGGQHFLSGMSKVDHDHFVRRYHEKRNPSLVKRLDVMNKFLEMIERNGPLVHVQFDRAIGAPPRAVANMQSLKDRSEAALAELRAERA